MKAISGEFIATIGLNKLLEVFISLQRAKGEDELMVKDFYIKQAQYDINKLINLLEKQIDE